MHIFIAGPAAHWLSGTSAAAATAGSRARRGKIKKKIKITKKKTAEERGARWRVGRGRRRQKEGREMYGKKKEGGDKFGRQRGRGKPDKER